jgi:hypothetical protein
VVLEEPQRALLLGEGGRQAASDGGDVAGEQLVGQRLVVAAVEALGHQLRFPPPVGLRDQVQGGVGRPHGRDDLRPERPRPGRADPLPPRALGDVVEEQHGHVHAHPVAAVPERPQRRRRETAGRRGEGVELDHVGPGRQVRVASAGEDPSAHTQERLGGHGEISGGAGDGDLRVGRQPGVLDGDVVGDEVEHEALPSACELGPGDGEAGVAAEVLVDDVGTDGVRGAGHVGVGQVRHQLAGLVRPHLVGPVGGVGLRCQTPMSQTASVPGGRTASQASSGTVASVTRRPSSRPSSSSQTQVSISTTTGSTGQPCGVRLSRRAAGTGRRSAPRSPTS